MKKMLLVICFLICVSVVAGSELFSESFLVVIDNWLTDDVVADFNKDGIVNVIDYALIQSYGSDEYGLDTYGN